MLFGSVLAAFFGLSWCVSVAFQRSLRERHAPTPGARQRGESVEKMVYSFVLSFFCCFVAFLMLFCCFSAAFADLLMLFVVC